jgi:hypothetical protein
MPTFHDVGADHQFFPAISWLAEAGITAGDRNGALNPTVVVSRQAGGGPQPGPGTGVG